MLAVQAAPRMGSSQPPSDPYLPFGYSVDVDANHEPPEPPEPARGDPLLTENDNKYLETFFQEMTTNQYNMPSFGEGLNLSLSDNIFDLPPQFMGSATSFGQHPAATMQPLPSQSLTHNPQDFGVLPMGSNLMPPPPPPPPPHQPDLNHREPTDDVVNAAVTLLQNGAIRRNSNTNDGAFARRTVVPPVGHLRHQPLEEFKEEGRRSLSSDNQDNNTFRNWMFAPEHRHFSRHALPTDIQYGSDSSFSHVQGFMPNSNRDTTESMTKEQLKYLECLEPSQSGNNTRPGSPNHAHAIPLPDHDQHFSDMAKGPEDVDAPPRKRRKSKNSKEVVDEVEEDMITPKTARRRKSKPDRSVSISFNPVENNPGGKRRKSSANGAKAARENLSEEQKRENHIRSEQKRRTLIKEGFDDLCELVPGLNGGGFSKSTMLTMAGDWLDGLIRDNAVLSSQLAKMEGR